MAVDILSHLIAGGPVMIPIGILSVLGLMSALERAWNLPKSRKKGKEELKRLVLESLSRDDRLVFLEEKGRQLVGRQMKKTFLLGVTATVAPMLGLLGTVLGMIVTFQDIQVAGVGDPAALAGARGRLPAPDACSGWPRPAPVVTARAIVRAGDVVVESAGVTCCSQAVSQ